MKTEQRERTKFRAWITKYALTAGIKEIEAEDRFDISETMISDIGDKYGALYHGRDWHRTPEAAVDRASEMRDAKIISLQKQIIKLKAMTFGIKP